MINLTRNSTTDVVLTLTEKGTATYYLFEFRSKATRAYSYTIQQDTSAHPERYNTFAIKEIGTPDPEDGSIELLEGEYYYTVYANSSSSNIDPSGLTVLETGLALVTDTEASDNIYTVTQTHNVYEG